MHPSRPGLIVAGLWILAMLAATACITDSVPPDIYSEAPESSESATPDDTERPNARETEPSRPTSTPASELDPGALPAGASASFSPSSGSVGSCDLRGHWLITQRTVASGLGVKQRAASWFYYEIEQNGSDLNVKRGLVCGSRVFPIDPLSAAAEFDASFPTLIEKNSHAGRRGTVVASGTDCAASFDRVTIVIGATMPFYADERNALPTLDEAASGTSPGWEDWDDDGHPAVSVNVNGLVQGSRYTVIRSFSEWSGTIASGATSFELSVPDWGQDEAILGVTTDVLEQTGVPDSDRTGHFTEFAKLATEHVQEDALGMCAAVRRLAPMLTPNANR